MSSRPPKAPGAPLSPDEVRGALRELGHRPLQTEADEREFGAELHRRLAAAGEPPTFGWFARLWEGVARARPMLTGALLGALVTATAFLLLGARGPARDVETTVDRSASAPPPALIEERPTPRPSPSMMGRGRTMGDRHVTRDRMTDDIGAERPERLHGRGR
jgi:hypothetical protein